jgi:POT family proton-dependent oligopeptide transporter
MAINIGSIFALIIGPSVSSRFGWHSAFFLSFIGLSMALANYAYCRKMVANINYGADKESTSWSKLAVLLVMTVAMTVASAYLLKHVFLTECLLAVISVLVFFMFMRYALQEKGPARGRMLVSLVLMVEAIVFFTLYQQMPTSLNFFAIHNVEHKLFGLMIDPQTFQVLNPIWIMLLSPFLAVVYLKLHKMNKDITTAHKFAFGMTLCGISFSLLYFTRFFANEAGVVSWWWLVASYFFQSFGELLVSALGVAMVAELVPQEITGFIMGMWFLTSSISGFTGAYVASLTTVKTSGFKTGFDSLLVYSNVFLEIGLVTLALSVIMWFMAPFLSRIINQR